ncbi:hypothetical protein [Gallibacterium anatis]|uniref:hypothetical protein n=1 Tax=Gallibacterium anatis TaxID=750 RepID=UPI0039FBA37C
MFVYQCQQGGFAQGWGLGADFALADLGDDGEKFTVGQHALIAGGLVLVAKDVGGQTVDV